MLEVESLQVRAGAFQLGELGLRVGAGECHAVLGPSGAGKSTLLAALLGIRQPEAGRIRIAGRDVTHEPTEHRGLGYVPQGLALFPHLTVEQNLAYGARARGLEPSRYRPELARLAQVTGISALLGRWPSTLSGGERQRVALVRAIVSQPSVLLLDEPFVALDESLRRDLWWLVRQLRRDRGLTVVLVTHDLGEACFLADRFTILIDGRVEQQGEGQAVLERPATLAAARFLGVRNLIPSVVRAVEGARLRVECAALGSVAGVDPGNSRANAGARGWLGIHPHRIALRDDRHPPRPDDVVLTGRVELNNLANQSLVHFYHDASPLVLELQMLARAAQRFGLIDGRQDVKVGLPAESLFWVPER